MMNRLNSISVFLRNNLGVVCCVAVLAIIVATLWPFDFYPANEVTWLPEGTGLRFGGKGIVLSKVPLDRGSVSSRKPCTLEILLRPANVKSPGTIASFYSAETGSELKFFRKGNTLGITRAFLNGREDLRSLTSGVDNIFDNGKLLFLTITSGRNGTTIYKNGSQPQIRAQLKITAEEFSGQIILGSAAMRFEPYSGEIRGLAIYFRELAPAEVRRDFQTWTSAGALGPTSSSGAVAVYRFGEGSGRLTHSAFGSVPALQIPRQFALPHKPFLESPADEFSFDRRYAVSVAENVVGFMPLGFVFCAYFIRRRRAGRAFLYAVALAGALSLTVEIAQYYIPSRGSGLTDVITNAAGAALGALLARHMLPPGPRASEEIAVPNNAVSR